MNLQLLRNLALNKKICSVCVEYTLSFELNIVLVKKYVCQAATVVNNLVAVFYYLNPTVLMKKH